MVLVGGGTGGAGTATFKAVAAIIETNCTTSDCHGTSSNHTVFDMQATLRTTLLGMPGGDKGMNGTCMDQTLVVPSMPEKSLLYNIVNANPPCASRMPYKCGKQGEARVPESTGHTDHPRLDRSRRPRVSYGKRATNACAF